MSTSQQYTSYQTYGSDQNDIDAEGNAPATQAAFYGNSPYLTTLSQQAQTNAAAAQNKTAPVLGPAPQMTATNANAAQAAPVYANQTGANAEDALLGQLAGQAAGTSGPSAADLQYQAQLGQSIAAQQGIAATQGGRNPALANRQAAINAATMTQTGANQAAQTRVQEQLNAENLLGTVGANVQGQALSQAQLQAQQNQYNTGNAQQVNLANASAANTAAGTNVGLLGQFATTNAANQLTQNSQNNAFTQAEQTLGGQVSQGNQANQQAAQQFQAANYNTIAAVNQKVSEGNQATTNAGIGATAAAIGTGLSAAATAASDERVKKNVSDGDDDIDKLLGSIAPKKYEYKEPKGGLTPEGEHLGVMAQDLEKSKLGDDMVEDTPDGKVVNYGQHLGTIMGALARLHKRLDRVEGVKR
jgi:hypothetical protein